MDTTKGKKVLRGLTPIQKRRKAGTLKGAQKYLKEMEQLLAPNREAERKAREIEFNRPYENVNGWYR